MNISEMRNSEVEKLKAALKRSYLASKAIYEYRDYIEQIKEYIALEEITGADELWNELEYGVQKKLFTAPLYGGAFTTKERAIIRDFWKIDRKSTRLNSSHQLISYAVFCLKKKTQQLYSSG